MLQPPMISLPDPLFEEEGSVDPLSLQRTYERLADRILPAVTVRMSRIRFVTAMCVGSFACSKFDEDKLAADGVTPPWLVYEWFVIEALARSNEDVDKQAIAGLRKVRGCLQTQRPVGAATYLKTPKVFGFTGIFRRLATSATILGEDLDLDDGGWELLRAWEKDESLGGICDNSGGPGTVFIRELRDAIEAGLERGHTVARPSSFWERVAKHLIPTRIGARERAVLFERIRGTQEMSREIVDDLAARGDVVARSVEADYLRAFAPKTSPGLRRILTAIDAYESLCRPITDAFALVRHLSTLRSGAAVGAADFASDSRSTRLVEAATKGCRRIAQDAALLDLEPDVRVLVDAFGEIKTAGDLFHAVVTHHNWAQREKPPDGKRPWLEPGRSDSMMVRPAYAVPELDPEPPPYVHDYRTGTVGRFLHDLGRFS